MGGPEATAALHDRVEDNPRLLYFDPTSALPKPARAQAGA